MMHAVEEPLCACDWALPRLLTAQLVYLSKGYFFSWWNVVDLVALSVAWPLFGAGSVSGVSCLECFIIMCAQCCRDHWQLNRTTAL